MKDRHQSSNARYYPPLPTPSAGDIPVGRWTCLRYARSNGLIPYDATTMARHFLARPSRRILTISLIATSTLVILTYLFHRQPHLLPRPWKYDGTQSWEWGRLREDWSVPERLGVTGWQDDSHVEQQDEWREEQVEESEPPHEWDTTCHEAVERNLRVALYDYTPFHEGEFVECSFRAGMLIVRLAEVIGSVLSTLSDTGIQTDLYRESSRTAKYRRYLTRHPVTATRCCIDLSIRLSRDSGNLLPLGRWKGFPSLGLVVAEASGRRV